MNYRSFKVTFSREPSHETEDDMWVAQFGGDYPNSTVKGCSNHSPELAFEYLLKNVAGHKHAINNEWKFLNKVEEFFEIEKKQVKDG